MRSLVTDTDVNMAANNEFTPNPDAACGGDNVRLFARRRPAAAPALRYGLQPGGTQLMQELADTLHAVVDRCQPHALPAAAKAALRGYVCDPRLLGAVHRAGSAEHYRRHVVYADPGRQFSVLAIVWQPGQRTRIHGHSAWGAVGVYSGSPYCENFAACTAPDAPQTWQPTMKLRLAAGDLATVEPGAHDVHRIGNDGPTPCITVHVYGRDLLANPASININLD